MSTRHLLTLDAPVTAADVTKFLPHLENALAGNGPAVHALPRGKADQHSVGSRPLEFDDIAVVVSTSGTSGQPKLAMLSRSAITASVAATHQALGGPGRWLLMVPTSHIAGVQVLTRSIMAGYSPTVLDLSTSFRSKGFAAAVDNLLGAAGSERRYTSLVPTQLRRILDAGAEAVAQLVAFDAVLLGGSAPPPALVERAEGAGINIVESYGMTETSAGCVYDGMPLTGVQVTLGASDRIEIRGPVIFSGYHGEPELSRIAL
ncbi:MAG: AMP-binding protein, partial [Candidatus Nanopelagicales bacterium]